MSVSKFEFIGIAASVLAMAGALWFFRLDSAPVAIESEVPDDSQSAIVVEDGANQSASIANAVIDASDGEGNLSQLVIDDITIGTGDVVKEGDEVTVHYIGRLQNGQEFDNSFSRGTPFSFTVGEGKVIAGWEEGLLGMKVGGERILIIPASLGYGDRGFGPIPGGATLVFAIELLAIES